MLHPNYSSLSPPLFLSLPFASTAPKLKDQTHSEKKQAIQWYPPNMAYMITSGLGKAIWDEAKGHKSKERGQQQSLLSLLGISQ